MYGVLRASRDNLHHPIRAGHRARRRCRRASQSVPMPMHRYPYQSDTTSLRRRCRETSFLRMSEPAPARMKDGGPLFTATVSVRTEVLRTASKTLVLVASAVQLRQQHATRTLSESSRRFTKTSHRCGMKCGDALDPMAVKETRGLVQASSRKLPFCPIPQFPVCQAASDRSQGGWDR